MAFFGVCVCIFFHANLKTVLSFLFLVVFKRGRREKNNFGSDYFMYVCVFVIVVVGLCVIFREYSLIFVYLCVNIDWLFSLGSATFFSAPT